MIRCSPCSQPLSETKTIIVFLQLVGLAQGLDQLGDVVVDREQRAGAALVVELRAGRSASSLSGGARRPVRFDGLSEMSASLKLGGRGSVVALALVCA